MWHEIPGASTIVIKKHVEETRTGKLQNLSMKGSDSCLCSTALNGQGKAEQKPVCILHGTHLKPGHWCFLEPARVRKYVVDRNFQRTSRNMRFYRVADGSHVQVSDFTSNISSDTAILAWKGGRNYRPQGAYENKKLRLKTMTMLASNLPCITLEFASGMRLKIRYSHRQERKTENTSIST